MVLICCASHFYEQYAQINHQNKTRNIYWSKLHILIKKLTSNLGSNQKVAGCTYPDLMEFHLDSDTSESI